jgi:spore maturation protein A
LKEIKQNSTENLVDFSLKHYRLSVIMESIWTYSVFKGNIWNVSFGGIGMVMALVWTGMVLFSVICALITGNEDVLAAATLQGAEAAVQLCISMAGILCLWMGVMEIMKRAGLAEKIARLLQPILGRLFPDFRKDQDVMSTIAANVSANLLGLGNAATPLGLDAARKMSRKTPGVAGDSLCMLVVCNTASIQLIPSTVAGVRMAAGCHTPFDILPAVWLASLISVSVGICVAKLFSKFWRD